MQNEPNYTARWESCRFHPFERVNAEDTIAGYNKALEAFHAKISQRERVPQILGPEPIGVGHNNLQNYLLHLDKSLIDGVAFHLYHGVDPENPWATSEIKTIGDLAPELPYHQTEYERSDWFNISGLIYKCLVDANVVSYYYWNLIWENTNCELLGELDTSTLTVPKRSITTIQFVDTTRSNNVNALKIDQAKSSFYPNPLNQTATITFSLPESDQLSLVIFNSNGKIARKEIIKNEANSNQYTFHRNGLSNGLYLYRIANKKGVSHSGRFIISD